MRGNATKKRGTVANWRLTEDPNVQSVCHKVARSITDMNKGVFEEDDLYQEALIIVAGTPHIAEQAISGDYGLLYRRVRTELMQKFVEKMDRSGELMARKYKNVVIEDADNETSPHMTFDDGTGDYTAEAVKLLLPAVWDESYAYGLPDREDAPGQDMPRAAGNKAKSNAHWAYIADIKTAWDKTPLTTLQRRALLMSFGLGYTDELIATIEGVTRETITIRVGASINKMTAHLNGARIEEEK